MRYFGLIIIIVTNVLNKYNFNNYNNRELHQHNIVFAKEVDSIFRKLKEKDLDNIFIFYQDGIVKTGFLYWSENQKKYGIAFKKETGQKIETKMIKKRILIKYKTAFANIDSLFSKEKEYQSDSNQINHAFNVAWVRQQNQLTDTFCVKIADIVNKYNAQISKLFTHCNEIYKSAW